jgi:large subunit ribosomal protein L29
MDIDKVRELTDNEMADELVKQRRHLYDLRFQLATRQLTDYSQLTQTRRTIARLLTVATEREQTGSGPVPAPERKPAAKATPAPARARRSRAATTEPAEASAAKPAGGSARGEE